MIKPGDVIVDRETERVYVLKKHPDRVNYQHTDLVKFYFTLTHLEDLYRKYIWSVDLNPKAFKDDVELMEEEAFKMFQSHFKLHKDYYKKQRQDKEVNEWLK